MRKTVILYLLAAFLTACREPAAQTTEEQPAQNTTVQDTLPPKVDTTGIAALKPTGWVNDFENLFTTEEEKKLHALIDAYEKQTTIEIAVVTLDTAHVGENQNDIYEASLAIANNWGVGKKGKDNGILVGISAGRMTMYIQNGHGIEALLPDEKTQEIIDEVFIPRYAGNKYFEGTYEGVKALMAAIPQETKKQ